ncbi:hypothetical protein M011DRAFT_78014 [Sporormia fimetaria CBS 119925]|uniref:F-box domain-containing protein n=1 Tax=Sporormia fimetaria CBS 119925 TaxID=1340428 RepID=A0A6A6V818_9PLEO|nr:hypothetical protein M011DRAFT_78014 [Sporormia fimetaria CBS 119925]
MMAGYVPATPSLPGIPIELRDAIFATITRRDLANLAQTCKALHFATLPALYSDLVLTCDPDDPTPINRTPLAQHAKLLGTLINKPHYALCVRSIHLQSVQSNWDLPREDDEESLIEKGRQVEALRYLFAENLCLTMPDELTIAWMVLSLCEQLRSLIMPANMVRGSMTWLHKVFVADQPIAPGNKSTRMPLSTLATLTVPLRTCIKDLGILAYRMTFDRAVQFLMPNLPALLHLRTPRLVESERLMTLESLRALRLDSTSEPAENVAAILKRLPCLEELYLDLFLENCYPNYRLDHLREGLGHVRRTLKALTVEFATYSGFDDMTTESNGYAHGSLGPLRDFTALVELNIPLPLLFGCIPSEDAPPLGHMLPPALKSLTVNDDLWHLGLPKFFWTGRSVMDVARQFFNEDCRETTPRLQDFTLSLSLKSREDIDGTYWENPAIHEELRSIAGRTKAMIVSASELDSYDRRYMDDESSLLLLLDEVWPSKVVYNGYA